MPLGLQHLRNLDLPDTESRRGGYSDAVEYAYSVQWNPR